MQYFCTVITQFFLSTAICFLVYICSNKKVVYCLNWSKEDMSAAASREIPMTKQVIDSLATLGEAKRKFLSPSWRGSPGYF